MARKSMVDSVKETADAVNKKIGQVAAEGIQKTRMIPQDFFPQTSSLIHLIEEVTNSTTEENVGAAQGKASEMSGKASGSASELSGEAKGKANEMMGKAQGKMEEMKGKM